jgi:hypothetical protein
VTRKKQVLQSIGATIYVALTCLLEHSDCFGKSVKKALVDLDTQFGETNFSLQPNTGRTAKTNRKGPNLIDIRGKT